MIHVLLVPSWYPTYEGDAVGSFFREQAVALAHNGARVGVIYPDFRSLKKWPTVGIRPITCERTDDAGVATFRSRGTNWFPRLALGIQYLWIRAGLKLFGDYLTKCGKPDILHAHSLLYGGVLAAEISRRYNIPYVVTEHSSAFALNRLSPVELCLAKSAAHKAAARLAVSDHLSKWLSAHAIGAIPWCTIPNIVDDQFLAHPLTPREQSVRFNFINIAFANANKRQANIIHAFAASFSQIENATLIIGGDGPELPRLKQLAKALAVQDRIEFVGRLSRQAVLRALANADAFVLASAYETFGVAAIEALALGKPVVATRCGGPESFVGPEDGVLVEIDDIKGLGSAMLTIYRNAEKFDPNKIRSRCRNRFSSTVVVEQLLAEYSRVIESAPQSLSNPPAKYEST